MTLLRASPGGRLYSLCQSGTAYGRKANCQLETGNREPQVFGNEVRIWYIRARGQPRRVE